MSRINQVFEKLAEKKERALIPYVCCGDPTLDFTEKIVLKLAESGADIIELGIPYSDPVADGPTIQKASVRALENGVNLQDIFGLVARIREKSQVPLILMTYYNPIFVYGQERFLDQAVSAGTDGLIIPDLPAEEAETLSGLAQSKGIDLILLATPTSSPERLEMIGEKSRGYVYCVSVTGVTGARKTLSGKVGEMIKILREKTKLPLVVGFGISGPEAAREIGKDADGVIVGSALIDLIEKNPDQDQAIEEAAKFTARLKAAIS